MGITDKSLLRSVVPIFDSLWGESPASGDLQSKSVIVHRLS